MARFPTCRSILFMPLLALVAALAAHGAGEPGFTALKPGPWGHLEYQTMYLSVPDALIDEFPIPAPQPRWCFSNGSAAEVEAILIGAGLDHAVRDRLLADPRSHRDAEGIVSLFPSPAEVGSLPPATRSAIYRELAKYTQNPFLHDPICIPDGDIDAWLRGTNLPDAVVSLVKKVAYKDDDSLLFGDFAAVLGLAGSDGEARRWIKAITRTRAVVAYLTVDETSDLPALRRYWSANYHRKDSLPLLNATAELEHGGRIDLVHLLPPLPRRLAYAYTTPELDRIGQTPNCHWTSLNFFNYTRQNVLIDLKLAASQVLEDYEKVDGPPTFGDVLFFVDDQGNAYHSCVYLADELVFSKNGGNMVMPWIITRLADIKQLYLHGKPGAAINVFRRRWPAEED
jgi:hypothetical protein